MVNQADLRIQRVKKRRGENEEEIKKIKIYIYNKKG